MSLAWKTINHNMFRAKGMVKNMNFIKKNKKIIIYCVTIIFSILFIFIGNKVCQIKTPGIVVEAHTFTGKVTKIVDVFLDEFSIGGEENISNKTIFFNVELNSGELKGKTVLASQTIDGMMSTNPKDVEEGDSVIVMYDTLNGETMEWLFAEYHRSDTLIWLLAVFFILLLIFGHKKGLNTIVSLGFTCLAIFMVFIPSVLSGMNIYVTSSVMCIFIVPMTLLIVNGADKKTFCAAVGCLGGLVVTGILTVFMDKVLMLTGALDQESQFLILLNEDNPINLRALIFGAIIIGALGATMDVSMSIASSLKELSDNMHEKTYRKLVKSGFNIGRDVMGTMANTLILAYIGSSLSVVLLLVANSGSILNLFNREMIVVEVMQALVGSLGILFTIPITSILSAYVYNKKPKIKNDELPLNAIGAIPVEMDIYTTAIDSQDNDNYEVEIEQNDSQAQNTEIDIGNN